MGNKNGARKLRVMQRKYWKHNILKGEGEGLSDWVWSPYFALTFLLVRFPCIHPKKSDNVHSIFRWYYTRSPLQHSFPQASKCIVEWCFRNT